MRGAQGPSRREGPVVRMTQGHLAAVQPSADPYCGNCGHSNHEDPINSDFCWKFTPGGLCGCESWEPIGRDERDYFEYDDLYDPYQVDREAASL